MLARPSLRHCWLMSRRWRVWAAIAGAAYGLAVAAGVVIAGWHFISDVLGAAMVVGFWACLAMAILIQAGLEKTPPPRGSLRSR